MTTGQQIEKLIAEEGPISGAAIAGRLGLTRQAVNRHIARLVGEGKAVKSGSTRMARYRLTAPDEPDEADEAGEPAEQIFRKQYRLPGLEEDRVFSELALFLRLRRALSPNAFEIYQYAFTEMLNNAVDHSNAAVCLVTGKLGAYHCTFTVEENGVGIFRSIADKFSLADEADAVVELSKGKRTTQPERHSGEGIFFTSKCADRLTIISHRIRLIYDNAKGDVFVEQASNRRGTTVSFDIRRRSRRKLSHVFNAYAPPDFDFSFQRTRVNVRLLDTHYASRSAAKRLLAGLDRFREITLDFQGVDGIGQGFADQIFRVFSHEHPDIHIMVEDANPVVAAMIAHSRAPSE